MRIFGNLFGSKKPAEAKKTTAPKIEGEVSGPEVAEVKSYNSRKGYGFVTMANKPDVFVHHTVLPEDVTELKPGQRVSIRYGKVPKGIQAVEVKLI